MYTHLKATVTLYSAQRKRTCTTHESHDLLGCDTM